MPYKLEEAEGGWFVVNSDTGERKSKKPLAKKRALGQLRALYAFAPDAKAKEAADMETVTFQITAPADVLQRFASFLKDELESAGEGEIEDAEETEAPAPKAKEVSAAPTGIPAHGPSGLFSTPGLGGKLVKARIGKKKQSRKEWGELFAAAFKEAATHA
jgi:hypothetical protein